MKVVIGSRPDYWNSRLTFILAGMCAAVGLANIWKFPYLLGMHGSAFFFSYFMALMILGLPLFVLEVALGRSQAGNPYDAMRSVAKSTNSSALWSGFGLLAICASLLVMALYLVVGGMVVAYIFLFAFGHLQHASAVEITHIFNQLQSDSPQLIYWMTMFWLMTVIVSAKGVHRGLARAVRVLMPLCVLLLAGILFYVSELPSFGRATHYLLSWKGELSPQAWTDAFTQAFFSLSLGVGVMMTLGSYMPRQMPVARTLFLVALLDLLFALLAGLVVLPILEADNLALDYGFSLLFQSLPYALSDTSAERGLGVALFVMFSLAAWGSSILVMEPAVAFVDRRFKDRARFVSVVVVGALGWVLAYLAICSFSATEMRFQNMPLFAWYDNIAARVLIPVIGLSFSVYFGWFIPRSKIEQVLYFSQTWHYDILRIMLRWFVPVLILWVVAQRV